MSVAWDIPAGKTRNSGELAAFVAGYGPGNLAPVPAPEPQTWALLVAGFVVTGLAARRRGSQRLRQSQHPVLR
ncbi:MAG: PEPxxWA-CTERM sorting domain-containing protein [Burkholderiales bacterium]|nr:PEPxxWA-CTERM sorting domain-containing protein [Burkholderiales bacterium]